MDRLREISLGLVFAVPLSGCGSDGQSPPISGPAPVTTQEPSAPLLSPVHDPVLIAEDGEYYLYSTGGRDSGPVRAHKSADLVEWKPIPSPVQISDWVRTAVPGVSGFWAPDISRHGGEYRLYYSASTFGSQQSAIGLATSPTLDPDAPDYAWTDRGLAVSSTIGDDYNAIDANALVDRDGRSWLSFGSFWGGLMLIELDELSGLPLADADIVPIARRPADSDNAIEAPFIFERDGWYYLIASFDRCCRGADSTYNLVVGRSRDIQGPYLDRTGVSMLDGGGTVIAAASSGDRFQGPGHAGHYRDANGRDLLVYHAYDTQSKGAPTLRIAELRWDASWPTPIPLEQAQ